MYTASVRVGFTYFCVDAIGCTRASLGELFFVANFILLISLYLEDQ